mgnify:CR=1 FL=1
MAKLTAADVEKRISDYEAKALIHINHTKIWL